MKPLDDRIPLKIQTHRGDLDIKDILPFDKVYDYVTGKEVVVQKLIQLPRKPVYRIGYTDGREDFYQHDELIHLGNRNVRLDQFFRFEKPEPITQHPMPYDEVIREPLRPDPYVSGALLVYGEFDMPWINLPFFSRYDHPFINILVDRLGPGTQLGFKYQLHPILDRKRRRLGFRYTRSGDFVTWMDFFGVTMGSIHKKKHSEELPDIYIKASISDRWQFVRGVFDTGFDERDFPDDIAIGHRSEKRLRSFQRILWSLGVLSHIRPDPSLKRGRKYRLDILSHRNEWDKFFYQGKFYPVQHTNRRDSELRLRVKSFDLFGNAFSHGISLGEPGRLYITNNFLPRVSL